MQFSNYALQIPAKLFLWHVPETAAAKSLSAVIMNVPFVVHHFNVVTD